MRNIILVCAKCILAKICGIDDVEVVGQPLKPKVS